MSDDPTAHAETVFRSEGLIAETWSNQPGHIYGEHAHPYHKVLFCTEGSIVFHTPRGNIELTPGDRLDIPPGTPHSAVVGPSGATCMESRRS